MNAVVIDLKEFGRDIRDKQASAILRKVSTAIAKAKSGDCIVVDFRAVETMTSKACDTVASNLIQKHVDGKRLLLEKHLILLQVSDEVRHTIHLVMTSYNDAVLAYRDGKGPEILGHYPQFLRDTFVFICGHDAVTAHDVSDHLKVKVHVAAERLRRLTDWGFVVRGVRPSARKPVYEYRVVNPFR